MSLGTLRTNLRFHPLDEVPGPAQGRPCRRCGRVVWMRGRQIYCSAACKQADWRDRNTVERGRVCNRGLAKRNKRY